MTLNQEAFSRIENYHCIQKTLSNRSRCLLQREMWNLTCFEYWKVYQKCTYLSECFKKFHKLSRNFIQ